MKINTSKFLVIGLFLSFGCGQKSHEHDPEEDATEIEEAGGNQALYDEVMKIHDEVMPKMDDIFKTKEELRTKLASTNIVDEKKQEIEAGIAKLDSANQIMMDWMHNFNPPPDSLGEERAREYLETEMEKIKKVREDVNAAIEKGKSIQ